MGRPRLTSPLLRLLALACLLLAAAPAFSAARRPLPRAHRARDSRLARPALAVSEPLGEPGRSEHWAWGTAKIGALVVALWTSLDCALDPGIEYPWGLLNIVLPTALLVAPGAAVAACAQLPRRPLDAEASAVFLGDSLTQATLSADYLEVLAKRRGRRDFVNVGMNMRPASEALQGDLLEEVAKMAPKAVVLLGTNDLIRCTALPGLLRKPDSEFLAEYEKNLREVAGRLRRGGASSVTIASAPPLGECLESDEGRLGIAMAAVAKSVAQEPGCSYASLHEAVSKELRGAKAEGRLAVRSRPYNLGESLALLVALPWRLYAGGATLQELQAEQELELTVDLVHYGPRFAELAADVFEKSLAEA